MCGTGGARAVANDLEFERHSATIEWDSFEGFGFMDWFGPMVMAKQLLGEQFGELRQQIIRIWSQKTKRTTGRCRYRRNICCRSST